MEVNKFVHEGHEVRIFFKEGKRNNKEYWFAIDGRLITFAAHQARSEQIARNYCELMKTEYHFISRKCYFSKPVIV